MNNHSPTHAGPSILPVERLLPQPSPDATVLVRLVTTSFAADGNKEPTMWALNQPHPLVTEAKVVRMYLRDDEGVDVYWSDGQMFLRTYVPERAVIFFDEVMGEDTFIAFIEQAEAGEEEPDPGPEPDPAPPQSPGTASDPGATA